MSKPRRQNPVPRPSFPRRIRSISLPRSRVKLPRDGDLFILHRHAGDRARCKKLSRDAPVRASAPPVSIKGEKISIFHSATLEYENESKQQKKARKN